MRMNHERNWVERKQLTEETPDELKGRKALTRECVGEMKNEDVWRKVRPMRKRKAIYEHQR